MKFLRFFLLFLPFISTIEFNCEFLFNYWDGIGLIYECRLIDDPLITSPKKIITTVTGNHYNSSMSHSNVLGFFSSSNSYTINYMPQGLNKIFPNLIFICIYKDHMKEIDQKDLEQYPKLKGLDLETNDIEYLEKDLFKFNTELQYLHFGNNKISQIHPTIFDHLNKLEYLELQGNQCINKGNTGRSGVLELIKEVKEKCLPEILFVSKQLQTLNETINNNFKSIENQLNEKSSKLSNLELKNENMINLINKNIQSIKSDMNQKIESNANNMNNEIKNLMIKFGEQNEQMNQNLKDLKIHLQLKSENTINNVNKSIKSIKLEVDQKIESTIRNITKEIQNLLIKFGEQNEKIKLKFINMSSIINKQNENNHEKFGGQYDKMDQNLNNHKNETNQQYINLKTDMMQKFVFIALPLICLFTSLNIAIIYLCCRKYARMGNRKKTSLSNDFELQERRL